MHDKEVEETLAVISMNVSIAGSPLCTAAAAVRRTGKKYDSHGDDLKQS